MSTVRGYDLDSRMTAAPRLQTFKEEHLNGVSEAVTEVVKTQMKNFTPETDADVAEWLKVGVAIALTVVAVFALFAAWNVAGAHVAFAAVAGGVSILTGFALLGFSRYLEKKAANRKEDEETVDSIHKDAMNYRITKQIKQNDMQDGMENVMTSAERRRALAQRRLEEESLRRRSLEAQRPAPSAPSFANGLDREEIVELYA